MGFGVQKWVKPTLNPFRDFCETPLFTQFNGGGWKLFSKRGPEAGLTQHKPLIQNNDLPGGTVKVPASVSDLMDHGGADGHWHLDRVVLSLESLTLPQTQSCQEEDCEAQRLKNSRSP